MAAHSDHEGHEAVAAGYTTETVEVSGDRLVDKVKQLIHEGNVRRLRIDNAEGETVLDLPVTVGVIGLLVAPAVTAIGTLGALAADYSIEIERESSTAQSLDAVDTPARGHLELVARLKIRPGQLDGFKAQAAEIMRISRELDTQTLRYDWFINAEGTESEVHEVYQSEAGLMEHNQHIMQAREILFRDHAFDHQMAAYGGISQQLRDLAHKHAGGISEFTFLQGLERSPAV